MKQRNFYALALTGLLLAHPAAAAPSQDAATEQAAPVPPATAGAPTLEFDGQGDYPSQNGGLMLWCLSTVGEGNYEGAEKACGAWITLNPANPVSYKARGTAYLMERRYELARLDFTQAVKLDSSDPESHGGLGIALREEGKYNESMAQFAVAIQLAPLDARMWNARCWTHGAFSYDLHEGLADCNRALRLAPGDPEYHDSRGLVSLRMGKLADAIKDYGAALREKPDLATALYGRGVAHLRSGDWKAARADILHARKIDVAVDDIFAWRPLIPQRCARDLAYAQAWKCRPLQGPVDNSSLHGKTALYSLIKEPFASRAWFVSLVP